MTDLIRSTATEVVGLLRAGDVSPTEVLDVLEEHVLATDKAVNALPIWLQPTARLLVAGLSTADIAQRTGVTVRSVQRRKHDIAQALR